MTKSKGGKSKNPQKRGPKAHFSGHQLVFLESKADQWQVCSDNKTLPAFYNEVTRDFLGDYGEERPFNVHIEVDADLSDLQLGRGESPDAPAPTGLEILKSQRAFTDLRKKLGQWFRYWYLHPKVKTIGGASATIPNPFLDVMGGAIETPPRKLAAIHTYSKLFYASRMKEEYERRYAVAKLAWNNATEAERASDGVDRPVPVSLRAKLVREFWQLETSEMRLEMQDAANKDHAEAVEAWKALKIKPKTALQFHQQLAFSAQYLRPVADAIANQMQVAVSICLIGPVGASNGEIEVRSVHVNWPGGPKDATWPNHDAPSYTAAEASIPYHDTNTYPIASSECQRRALIIEEARKESDETGVEDLEEDDPFDTSSPAVPAPTRATTAAPAPVVTAGSPPTAAAVLAAGAAAVAPTVTAVSTPIPAPAIARAATPAVAPTPAPVIASAPAPVVALAPATVTAPATTAPAADMRIAAPVPLRGDRARNTGTGYYTPIERPSSTDSMDVPLIDDIFAQDSPPPMRRWRKRLTPPAEDDIPHFPPTPPPTQPATSPPAEPIIASPPTAAAALPAEPIVASPPAAAAALPAEPIAASPPAAAAALPAEPITASPPTAAAALPAEPITASPPTAAAALPAEPIIASPPSSAVIQFVSDTLDEEVNLTDMPSHVKLIHTFLTQTSAGAAAGKRVPRDWGELWDIATREYLEFQRLAGYPDGGPAFGTADRPEMIGWWMKSHRPWKLVPLKDAKGFGTQLLHWWSSLQPDSPGPESDWSKLCKPGKNGMLLLFIGLVWWGKVARETEEWKVATTQIIRALQYMRAAAGSSVTEASTGAGSKRARGGESGKAKKKSKK
ncbi:hypothetical protein HWV62_38180 [Athelia sp. TMB]|nr:hypothetical protein HWV62_38180 [Athelia sp. TMB]